MVADALRRGRPFAVGDQRQGGPAALVAEQVDLEARDGVAEAGQRVRGAGTAGRAREAVEGREIHLEVDIVQQAELECRISDHPDPVVRVRCGHVVEAVDEDIAFVLDVTRVDRVGHVRLGRTIGAEAAHLIDRRRVEQRVHALVLGVGG